MNYIGVNGMPTPDAEAVISVMDHGFMYGMGLFETFRTYEGVPCLLERHLNRLSEGCRVLGISYEADASRVRAEVAELLKLNGLNDGYIRLTVSAGEGPLGLFAGEYAKPAVIMYVKALPETDPAVYVHGKKLFRLRTVRNTPESEVRLKSLHYMNNLLARRELAEYERQQASAPGASLSFAPPEGLMLTKEGDLAEGIASNIFFAMDGKLYTPEIRTGILPGITRGAVLEHAASLGLDVEEGRYAWDKLVQAEEIFLTNSIQELVPVTLLLEPDTGRTFRIGGGQIGPVTKRLLHFYRESVGNGCADKTV